MGWKLKSLDVNLEPNEEQDIVVVLAPENRAAIHGIVKFPDGTPARNALVKLFKRKKCSDPCDLTPVTFTFADECGQFMFGVDSRVDYVIKVFFYKPEKVRCDGKEKDEKEKKDC